MSTQSVLAIIPVRGGSRRIPRKWAQLVDGRPLLQHTIDIARATEGIDRLAVCTEDPAAAAYARLRGVDVIDRPAHLAEDDVTLAELARWIVTDRGGYGAEAGWQGDLLILQPTCPLLKPETLAAGIAEWRRTNFDWMISAVPESHIIWQDGRPLTPRVNSQQLAESSRGLQRESGAFQIGNNRFFRAPNLHLGIRTTFTIPAEEALDIDTFADLAAARQSLGRRTIGFHVVASDEKGSGHLRRCLQLSDALAHHDVRWFQPGLDVWALDLAAKHGVTFDNRVRPDLVVLDVLEDADRLARMYAAQGIPTVVFEPEGPCRFADLIVDEFATPAWTILRPEFLCLPPYEVLEKADRVLITFGGTDPSGMNDRVERIVNHGVDAERIVMRPWVKASMAEAMRWADLVITSQGRTVHEAAAVGVPCLSIAVNERETRHAYLDGVIYLGLAHTLSDAAILDTVNRLLLSHSLRREMSATASKQIDGKGMARVVRKIEDLL